MIPTPDPQESEDDSSESTDNEDIPSTDNEDNPSTDNEDNPSTDNDDVPSNDGDNDEAVPQDTEGDNNEVLGSDPKVKKVVADLEHISSDEEEEDDLLVQPPSRCGKMMSLLREYAVFSSTHGVPHMGEAHTCRVVMFWCLILCCSLGAFCFLFFNTVIEYLSFPVLVNLQLESRERVFPAITICNLNPYKRSELIKEDLTNALVVAYESAIES